MALRRAKASPNYKAVLSIVARQAFSHHVRGQDAAVMMVLITRVRGGPGLSDARNPDSRREFSARVCGHFPKGWRGQLADCKSKSIDVEEKEGSEWSR